MIIKKGVLSLFLVATIFSCSSDDDDDATPSATSVTVNDGSAVGVGALALGSLTAGDLGITASSLRLNDDDGDAVSSRDSNCTNNGSPIKDGAVVSTTDTEYAERALYCTAAFNTASPDSALGAMTITSMLVCELERAQAWTSDADFTEAGNNVGQVTISLSENCAEDYVIAAMGLANPSFNLGEVTLTALGATAAYDKKISFSLEGDPKNVYIRNSGNVIAALADEGWSFSLDLVNGVLKYENVDSRYRRMRLKVQGALSTTGEFSSITSVDGFLMEFHSNSDDDDAAATDWSSFASVSGNVATGLSTATYYKDGNGNVTSREDGCTDTCTGNTRITATEAELDALFSGSSTAVSTMSSEAQIVGFDDVTATSTIDYTTSR